MEVFTHPSCQICLIVTGGYLNRIFNMGSAELRLPLTYLWMYPQDGETGVAPQLIIMWIRGEFHYFASVIPARFSCNVLRNKDALKVEFSHLYTQQIFIFRKVEATNFLQPEQATRR